MAALSHLSMFLNALILAALLAFSHGLLKWVATKEAASYFELISGYWLQIGVALAVYGFVFFYYVQVLRRHDIGILYSTYTGLSILLVLLVGVVLFGESLGRVQLLGIALVIIGIFLIGKS